ncbi:alpha/beta fold hydrolase [Providencia rettgeri]|uniref:alpha/beta fold hydrolase n=1 Tax=Providencia rettgeri TaxID=587 RepID=UPI003526921B
MQRHTIGWKELKAINGESATKTVNTIAATSQPLADALTDFAFGEIFSRAELARHERELSTIGMLAVLGGAEPQLRVHLNAALNVGVDPDELIALAEHVTLYAGFPRALNLLEETKQVLTDRGLSLPFSTARHFMGDHETLVTDTGGDLPVIVLVHALGLDRRMWRDVIPFLTKDYRVISYDLRGHGHAASGSNLSSLSVFADDFVALLNSLQLNKVHFVGLSFGGSIGQYVALQYPERLNSLTIIASTAWKNDAFESRATSAETHGMASQVIPSLTRWFSPAALADNGWEVRYARERIKRAFLLDWTASWRALAAIDTSERLKDIQTLTHIIAGENDLSTPPSLMEGFKVIANVTFDVISEGTHMLSLEKPQALGLLLLQRLIQA